MATDAAQGKRSGKYRHVYGDPAKPEKQFQEIKKPLTSGESQYVKASAKFFAVGGASAGKIYIRGLTQYGRFPTDVATLSPDKLKGTIWDFDFNPFMSNMLAMGADDCSVGISIFPEDRFADGQTGRFTETAVLLKGHSKKVCLVQFHPSASNILSTAAFDRTVKVWDIEKGTDVATFTDIGDNIYSCQWNKDGSRLAVTGKDKKLRLFDPRDIDNTSGTIEAFEGAKSSKCFWAPQLNWVGATGFSKQAKRQLKFWDLRDLSKPLYSNVIDQAASVLIPNFDDDNGLLYLAGKGDGTVSFGELINDSKKFYQLGMYRNNEPQKGGGWVPKRALDVWSCEVQRFLKLTQKSVIPIAFIVPRKAGADVFQEDIYPDCVNGKPALTADEWVGGENKNPLTMKMDPKLRTDDDSSGSTFTKKKTYDELVEENEILKKRVKELESQLGITSNDDDQKDDNDPTQSG